MRLFPDLRAAIDVEQRHRGRQRPGPRPQRRLDLGGRGLLGDDDGEVLLDREEARHGDVGRNRMRDLPQRVEVDLGDGDAGRLDTERLSPVGSQLAENADLVSIHEESRRPAGMERGGIDATELTFVDAESREQRLDRPLEIEEVELAAVGGTESPEWLPLARQTRCPGRSTSRGSSSLEGR